MSNEVQSNVVSSLNRSSSAETLSFGVCYICELVDEAVNCEEHVTIINNEVVLNCRQCHRQYHLKCLEEKFDVEKLIDAIESGYTCMLCE